MEYIFLIPTTIGFLLLIWLYYDGGKKHKKGERGNLFIALMGVLLSTILSIIGLFGGLT
jgi:hypothetical protein